MLGQLIWDLGAFIVALGILITVHEFGHFWVARRCGIWIERFSIGFGKALWKYQDKQGTEFVIALIPLGGYVKMLDERIAPVAASQHTYAFNNKTIAQRAAVVAAGPLANFLLAVLVYWWFFCQGVTSVKPVIGEVAPHSIAAQAGVTGGWQIQQVANTPTADWQAVQLALIAQIGAPTIPMTLAPLSQPSASRQVVLATDKWQFQSDRQDPLTTLGITPILPKAELMVAQVENNSPAQRADLQVGDKLLAIDQQPLKDWSQFVTIIQQHPDKTLSLTIERAQQRLLLSLTPSSKTTASGKTFGYVGVGPKVSTLASEYLVTKQYNLWQAWVQAVKKTGQITQLTLVMTGKLITGQINVNNLSGPIAIAQGAGSSAQYGMTSYLLFLALISINLGIINLFPLPILDGGHLLFLAIEKVQGRPVSERFQAAGYRIGIMCLILLMGLAFFNDISRLL